MTPIEFMTRYTEYFGEEAPLPIAVVYSDKPMGDVQATPPRQQRRNGYARCLEPDLWWWKTVRRSGLYSRHKTLEEINKYFRDCENAWRHILCFGKALKRLGTGNSLKIANFAT